MTEELREDARRLYEHLQAKVFVMADAIKPAERAGLVIVLADTADPTAATIVRGVLSDHPKPPSEDELAQLGTTSFYAIVPRDILKKHVTAAGVTWLGNLDRPLEPGEVRVAIFVEGGYQATRFTSTMQRGGVA